MIRRSALRTLAQREGSLFIAPFDVFMWYLALLLATFARFGFDWSRVDLGDIAAATAITGTVAVACGLVTGVYRGLWMLASFEEASRTAICAFTSTTVLFAVMAASSTPLVPRSAVLAAGAYQLVGSLGLRFVARAVSGYLNQSRHRRDHRVLIFGAGDAGFQAARVLQRDPEADMLPVAFLDDDPRKSRIRIAGLPIVGGRESIESARAQYVADLLLVAIPTADTDTISAIADRALDAGMSVRIVPRLAKYLQSNGRVEVSDIRDITIRDFLSRDETRLDLDQIAGYLNDRRVLVTGAGGSIGSQLCETVQSFGPSELIMVDRDENALQELQLRLEGRALLQSDNLILGDIRDPDEMLELFLRRKPHVVFHAAAHKHVTFLERFPEKAYRTNVQGTRNLLEASMRSGVERFVNISTDKAANPVSTLGLTKRAAEMLTAHYAMGAPGAYMSVRFGNVLGSRGSVIPIIEHQIRNGQPITITHPDVTRFFMTVGEAVQLVLQAGALGGEGEVLALDMGEPVKILDLARRLAAAIRPGVVPDIVFTGLRPGEKLHERIESTEDREMDRPHQLITRYAIPALNPIVLEELEAADSLVASGGELRRVVGMAEAETRLT